ncbi:MAG: FtsX-like permease family protein [Gemmatimonas sp.]|nr:FtsX-like permease family protein [Gemmatimonas sp.]
MLQALRGALAAFRRTPVLVVISILAVSLSLFVFGLFALTAFNIRGALSEIEERVEIVAYLSDDATAEEAGRAEVEIRDHTQVLDVRYVSKTEALAIAGRELPEFREVFSGLDANPLPASYEIRLRPGYRTPEVVEAVTAQVIAYPFVEEADYGRDWVARLVSLQRIAAGATVIIGGAFAAVAGIIIATAVRIAVAARREEIEIMRLVGATDGFIRRPFLIEGWLTGLIGGLIAAFLTYLAHRFVSATLMEINWLPAEWLMLAVLAGSAYGLLTSAFAVRRHLRGL